MKCVKVSLTGALAIGQKVIAASKAHFILHGHGSRRKVRAIAAADPK